MSGKSNEMPGAIVADGDIVVGFFGKHFAAEVAELQEIATTMVAISSCLVETCADRSDNIVEKEAMVPLTADSAVGSRTACCTYNRC
ncbi:unnamed protein product [Phytophthora fragariaefolia]|uniref:Unnamed protein product n=1 Tax=Phytophthora fragariaefolia TaxID=1490495 RepID=A0A9W6YN82_9STRA|nr:unnamed protein product [Phytophthora fragariaefolia]